MKKYVSTLLAVIGISAMFLNSCAPPPADECIYCESEGIAVFTKSYGKDSAITIYPVFTPKNYEYCDSFVFSPRNQTYVEPYLVYPSLKSCTDEEAKLNMQQGKTDVCVCRKNINAQYNDDINSNLVIEGVEKFRSVLNIRVMGDTSKIRSYVDYLYVGGTVKNEDRFNGMIMRGERTDSTSNYYEYTIQKMLASGVYEYELILYKDQYHQVSFDTIRNKFAIIRSPEDLNVGCAKAAKNKQDNLLK